MYVENYEMLMKEFKVFLFEFISKELESRLFKE